MRGRLRLADGTKSERFDVPEGVSEADARTYEPFAPLPANLLAQPLAKRVL